MIFKFFTLFCTASCRVDVHVMLLLLSMGNLTCAWLSRKKKGATETATALVWRPSRRRSTSSAAQVSPRHGVQRSSVALLRWNVVLWSDGSGGEDGEGGCGGAPRK